MRPANEIPFSKEPKPVKKQSFITKLAAGLIVFISIAICIMLLLTVIILIGKIFLFAVRL